MFQLVTYPWLLRIHVRALKLAGVLAATWGQQFAGLGAVSLSCTMFTHDHVYT